MWPTMSLKCALLVCTCCKTAASQLLAAIVHLLPALGACRNEDEALPSASSLATPAALPRLPSLQAAAMDAQQRLLLEGCWEALWRGSPGTAGGAQPGPEAARAVAVAVGISYTEYYLNSAHKVGLGLGRANCGLQAMGRRGMGSQGCHEQECRPRARMVREGRRKPPALMA